MPITLKNERDYLSALNDIGNIDDAAVKADVQAAIKDYELAKSTPLGAPGIAGFERSTGMSLPSDRKTRDAEHAASENPQIPSLINEATTASKRPSVIKGSLLSTINRPTWYEPTLEEFQAEMGPVLGPDEAAAVTEDSDLFRRYADAKWAQAYDAAKAGGESLLRVKDIPTETFAGKAVKGVAEFERYAKPVQHAVEEGITGGLVGNVRARFNEATGLDENAVEELERERARGGKGVRIAGNIAGVLSPGSIFNVAGKAASKLAAPVAGALIVKGGGKAIPRALGRGAVAATAGGAGMAAQGAAEDIAREGVAEGRNPFSLDFLGRRGTDLAIGGAAGVASEVLGTAASRLGNLGPVQKARDLVLEGAQATKLNPIIAAGGGAALGASFQTIDNDQRAFNMLVGASVGLGTGMGASLGRYALLNHLARSAAVAGEPAFKGMAKRLQAAPLAPDTIGAIRERMLPKGSEVFGGRAAVPAGQATPAIPATPGVEPRFVDVSQPGSRVRGRRTPGEGATPMGARPPKRREVFLPGKPGEPATPEIPGTPAIPAQPPQTGVGGAGMFGIPFTGGSDAASSATLSREEAEAFILDLIEEDRLEQEQIEAAGETSDAEPLVETEDSGETSSIGLPPSLTGEEMLPEVEISASDDATEPTTASMNARENQVAAREIAQHEASREGLAVTETEEEDAKLDAAAERYARRVAGPDADPLKIFVLKVQYIKHERERMQNMIGDDEVRRDMRLNPQHYRSTEKGRREVRKIKEGATRRGFYQPPDQG